MADSTLQLQRATDGDLDVVAALLSANDLPASDIRDSPGRFYLAYEGDRRVGVGGLELHGDAGLLRSVVVDASRRGEGYGTAISERLADRARAEGVDRLYLLTTTAADFFDARGYDRVLRDSVPEGIRESREFTDLCPDSATCMRKDL